MPRHRSAEAQVVRCIALLIALARAKRGLNLRQFAERRGWHWRAAYRDIETLRGAGVPIEHEHGWYRLTDNWIPAGTVDVKRDELLMLFALRHVVPGLKDTAIGRALDSLWAKLASPTRQVALPLGAEDWFVVRAAASIDYRPHQATFDVLRAAIETRRAVQLHYRKPDGAESHRTVEPAFLCWDAELSSLYVRGWCRLREELRTFAVHRIVAIELTEEAIAARREAAPGLLHAFRIWCGPHLERVVLRFSAAVAPEIRERRLHASQVTTEGSDGSLVVSMDVAAPEELERWLLGFGPDVEVIEPARLASRIRERHHQAAGGGRAGVLRARPRKRPTKAGAPTPVSLRRRARDVDIS